MERIDWKKLSLKLESWQKIFLAITLILGGMRLLLVLGKLPPQIPIFYSRPWGESQLGKPITLFIPLGITWLLALFSIQLNRKSDVDEALKVMISGAFLVSEIIMMMGVGRIILIVL